MSLLDENDGSPTRLGSLELPSHPASCRIARNFVAACLGRAEQSVCVDATLLVSELAANAVLHAEGAPFTVTVREKGGSFRIAVHDASRAPPIDKGYTVSDATGRGLALLSSMAAAWGWRPTETGKVVWFDVPRAFGRPGPPMPGTQVLNDPYPDGEVIRLIEAPIALMRRSRAHYDEVYREFRLILEREPDRRQAVPGQLISLLDQIHASFLGYGDVARDTWGTAVRENREAVDILFRLPAEARPLANHFNALLDEADQFCRDAALLTVAATDEALDVRRWVFSQVADQLNGCPPMAWPDWGTRSS